MKLLRRDFVGIGKQEIKRNPIQTLMSLAGTVFIDRFHHEKAIQALRPAIDALRHGIARDRAGRHRAAPRHQDRSKGAFFMAMEAGVPIVPIVLRNTLDARCRRTGWWCGRRRSTWTSCRRSRLVRGRGERRISKRHLAETHALYEETLRTGWSETAKIARMQSPLHLGYPRWRARSHGSADNPWTSAPDDHPDSAHGATQNPGVALVGARLPSAVSVRTPLPAASGANSISSRGGCSPCARLAAGRPGPDIQSLEDETVRRRRRSKGSAGSSRSGQIAQSSSAPGARPAITRRSVLSTGRGQRSALDGDLSSARTRFRLLVGEMFHARRAVPVTPSPLRGARRLQP